ncbi:hypothetical protein GN109_23280 [Collimonas pratensis]|uniref:DUF5906 domain-containing protein n=1 Tax=Collimonas pratensis TaxID=279113 RepID=UPI00143D3A56|nr:DUF5906 domain-containing protein [Collimonas pratensis]NKI72353.1 hypothetical protein [Collimonas pratensis]
MKESNPQFNLFSKEKAAEGWCFLASSKYTTLRLHNRFSGSTPPDNVACDMFRKWDKSCSSADGLVPYLKIALPLVAGDIFRPRGESYVTSYGSTWCNTYRSFQPKTEDRDVSPLFLEFLERLFPDDDERHICTQWLAHMVQKPEQRPSWHLMLTSDSGTGKGFLYGEILSKLLIHTVSIPTYSRLTAQFSTILEDNILCHLDDPKIGNDQMMTRIKSILSEETALIEHKGLETKTVPTFTRFVLSSNNDRPLRLDENDRRWYAPTKLMHRKDKEETQAFIIKLAAWLALPDSLSKVYNWFMHYPLTGFNHKHIHQSAQLKIMINLSAGAHDDFYASFLAEHPVFRYIDLTTAMKDEGYTKPSDAGIRRTLDESGYVQAQVSTKEGRVRCWHRTGIPVEQVKNVLEADF